VLFVVALIAGQPARTSSSCADRRPLRIPVFTPRADLFADRLAETCKSVARIKELAASLGPELPRLARDLQTAKAAHEAAAQPLEAERRLRIARARKKAADAAIALAPAIEPIVSACAHARGDLSARSAGVFLPRVLRDVRRGRSPDLAERARTLPQSFGGRRCPQAPGLSLGAGAARRFERRTAGGLRITNAAGTVLWTSDTPGATTLTVDGCFAYLSDDSDNLYWFQAACDVFNLTATANPIQATPVTSGSNSLVAVANPVVAQVYIDQRTRILLATSPSSCIHKKYADNNNGNPIHLWSCDQGSDDNKTWVYDEETQYIRLYADQTRRRFGSNARL
jgi:hypothetical protein